MTNLVRKFPKPPVTPHQGEVHTLRVAAVCQKFKSEPDIGHGHAKLHSQLMAQLGYVPRWQNIKSGGAGRSCAERSKLLSRKQFSWCGWLSQGLPRTWEPRRNSFQEELQYLQPHIPHSASGAVTNLGSEVVDSCASIQGLTFTVNSNHTRQGN